MNYLGLDIHSAHFLLAHMKANGKLCRIYDRPTSAKELIDVVWSIRGPKILAVEECHLAQWVKHTLEPHVDQLVICNPKHNKWIAADTYADDRTSARKIADLLRGGYVKQVIHPDETGAELRTIFLHYDKLTRDLARAKIRLKAVFREVAVRVKAVELYRSDERKHWFDKLNAYPGRKLRAKQFFQIIELFEQSKEDAWHQLRRRVKTHAAYEQLQTMPGIGPIIAMGYIALIDTPHRFGRKNKLWAYACLGNRQHISDGRTYENRGAHDGCRPLKHLVMQQFNAAVSRAKKDNRFKRQHQALLKRGVGTKAARRHVCRAMLSTVRAMWIKKEPYIDKQ